MFKRYKGILKTSENCGFFIWEQKLLLFSLKFVPAKNLIPLIRESFCHFFSLFVTVSVFKQLIKNYNFLISEVVFWDYSLTRLYIFQPCQSLFLGKCVSSCHSQKFVLEISRIFSSRNFQLLNESPIVVNLGSRNIYMKNLYFQWGSKQLLGVTKQG